MKCKLPRRCLSDRDFKSKRFVRNLKEGIFLTIRPQQILCLKVLLENFSDSSRALSQDTGTSYGTSGNVYNIVYTVYEPKQTNTFIFKWCRWSSYYRGSIWCKIKKLNKYTKLTLQIAAYKALWVQKTRWIDKENSFCWFRLETIYLQLSKQKSAGKDVRSICIRLPSSEFGPKVRPAFWWRTCLRDCDCNFWATKM